VGIGVRFRLDGRVYGSNLRSFAFQAEPLFAPRIDWLPLENHDHLARSHLKLHFMFDERAL